MAVFSKMSGRNRYKKICFKCAEMVPAHEGFLKSIKGEYFVYHEKECNPEFDMEAFKKNPVQPKSNKVKDRSNKEKTLESKMKTKQLPSNEPKDYGHNCSEVIVDELSEIDPHVLDFLEAELMKRKTMGLPIVTLPKVIAYIKFLKKRVDELTEIV